jgi:aryl-alcohol dehydrogenase-like predicted oxidoreductase
VAKIGLGTYRISDQNPEHIQAIRTAVEEGVDLIDTSTNYMDGGAERAIALAFQPLPHKMIENIEIVSKYGYIQGSTLKRVHEGEHFPEMVTYADHIYHCISPEFMQDQLTRSLERLNMDSLGCYLIHNPEYFLLDALQHDLDRNETLDRMFERIENAFEALEKEVQKGRIKSYGISSNSFALEVSNPEFLPYEDLVTIAKRAAKASGSEIHHFSTIQLPINLLETEGLKCADWAKMNGLRVLSNRPLNAQANHLMFRLASYDEPHDYYHHLNEVLTMTDDESLRSVHNMIAQLDDVKHRFGFVGEYEQFLYNQVIPHLRKTMQGLDPVAVELLAESLDLFLQEYAKMVAFECTKMTKVQLKEKLQGCDKRLQECAIDFLQAQTCIDYILIGMRKPSYVMQIIGGL